MLSGLSDGGGATAVVMKLFWQIYFYILIGFWKNPFKNRIKFIQFFSGFTKHYYCS